MLRKYLILFVVALILIQFSNCKKSENKSVPTIIIFSPAQNSTFNVLDTMKIIADVSDYNQLKSINISLVNENLIPVISPIFILPKSNSYKINIDYVIDDIHLSSGKYYILIIATNDYNSRKEYVNISLSEVEKQFESLIVITETGNNKLGINAIDTGFDLQELFTIESDYSSSIINSFYRQLFICGQNITNLNVLNIDKGKIDWSLEPIIYQPMHDFNCMFMKDNILYLAFSYKYINGYNQNGTIKFTAQAPITQLPTNPVRFGDYVAVNLKSKTAANGNIVAYYYISGAERHSFIAFNDVLNIFPLDDYSIISFEEANGSNLIKTYNFEDIYSNTDFTLPDGKINCIAHIDEDNFLIAYQNSIYSYNYYHNSTNLYIDNISATKMVYEKLNSRIFITDSDKIFIYDYSSASLVAEVPLAQNILGINLLYNK
jgi:hypothetical protein